MVARRRRADRRRGPRPRLASPRAGGGARLDPAHGRALLLDGLPRRAGVVDGRRRHVHGRQPARAGTGRSGSASCCSCVWVGLERVVAFREEVVAPPDRDRLMWIIVTVAVGVGVGGLRRGQTEAGERAEEQARRRVEQERLRLARDVHDVVSHSLAMIAVQAGRRCPRRRPAPGAGRRRAARDQGGEPVRAGRAARHPRRAARAGVPGVVGSGAPRRGRPGRAARGRRRGGARESRHPRHARRRRRVPHRARGRHQHRAPRAPCAAGHRGPRARRRRAAAAGGGRRGPAGEITPGNGLRGLAEHAAVLGGRSSAAPGPDGFVVEAALPLAKPGTQ